MSPPAVLRNVQALRALAVLLVALMHLEPHWRQLAGLPNGASDRILFRFGYSGVDLFFLISGFINYRVNIMAVGSWRASARFLLRRAIRILPNYWLVVAVAYYLLLHHGLHPVPEMVRPLESLLLIVPLRVPEHIMISAWTLNYELLFYAILAVLLLLPRLLWPAVLVYALAIALAQTQMEHWNADRLWEFALAPYFLQFFAGMGVAWLCDRNLVMRPGLWLIFSVTMGCIAVWMQTVPYPETFSNPFHRDLRVMVWLAVYAPMLYALVCLEMQRRWVCDARGIIGMGDASYSLYLWIIPGLHLWFMLPMPAEGVLAATAFALAGFGVYLAGSMGWHRRVERPMIKQLNNWMLGRKHA